jgi:uncharacterized membrane protein
MKKRCRLSILLVLVLIVFSLSIFADEIDEITSDTNTNSAYDVSLSLIDLTSNMPIQNVTLKYMVNGISSSTFIDETGLLRFSLPEGDYNLVVEAYKSSKQYTTYYGTFDLKLIDVVDSDSLIVTKTVYMYPVGLLRGFVKDSLDNIIPNAELKFECIAKVITQYPKKTDKFGFFKVENMPTSSCKVIASYEEAIGMTEVEIVNGELSEVTINLDKALLKNTGYNMYQFLALLLGALIVFLVIKYLNKRSMNKHSKPINLKSKKAVDKPKPSSEIITVSGTILKTLNNKEKTVVEFLLANGNKTSQAKIRHATGIPRTSLSRVLQSLENKKIINIEKHGKMVNINLTDFFLGKK